MTEPNMKKLIDDVANGSELDAFDAAKTIVKVQQSDCAMQLSEILKTAANPHNKQAAAYRVTKQGDKVMEVAMPATRLNRLR